MIAVREEAERFAIWRMGNLHNWECTYEDAATATGLPVTQVKRIRCRTSRPWSATRATPCPHTGPRCSAVTHGRAGRYRARSCAGRFRASGARSAATRSRQSSRNGEAMLRNLLTPEAHRDP